jgi:hypothetical protein
MRRPEIGDWGEATLALPDVWDQPGAPWVAALTAEACLRRGSYDRAEELATEAFDRAGADDQPWMAKTTQMLVAYVRGSFGRGMRIQSDVYATVDAHGDVYGSAAAALMDLIVLLYAGRDAEAGPALARLEAAAAATGCPTVRAMACLSEGRVRQAQDPAGARVLLQTSLELALSVDNTLIAAQARWALADLAAADDPAGALDDLRGMLAELRAADDNALLQQVLVRSLGPLISIGADDAALLVAGSLEGTVWAYAVRYLASLGRLEARTEPGARQAASVRARQLGLLGVADEVVTAVDRLASRA